jgi:hypothetical protein
VHITEKNKYPFRREHCISFSSSFFLTQSLSTIVLHTFSPYTITYKALRRKETSCTYLSDELMVSGHPQYVFLVTRNNGYKEVVDIFPVLGHKGSGTSL